MKTFEYLFLMFFMQEGNTPLMVPATRGYSIVVECLLQHNADPNIPNEV